MVIEKEKEKEKSKKNSKKDKKSELVKQTGDMTDKVSFNKHGSKQTKDDLKKTDMIRMESELLTLTTKLKNKEKNMELMTEQLSIYKLQIEEKNDEVKS